MRTLVWFRGKDLRLTDHAPLASAVASGEVVLLFVLDPYFFAKERATQLPHRMQFLLESLTSLEKNVARAGSRLIFARGQSHEVVPKLVETWKVDRVVAYRWTEPIGRERDRRVRRALNVPFDLFEGETLVPPGTVRTGQGAPFSVYTPFSRVVRRTLAEGVGSLIPAPRKIPMPPPDVKAEAGLRQDVIPTLSELGIVHNARIAVGGERRALERLRIFLDGVGEGYHRDRDRMDLPGTSRLSQDLKFGTLSVRAVWSRVLDGLEGAALERYTNELLWREFAYHCLFDRPELLREPFRRDFAGFPWTNKKALWHAWRTGTTGYPVVDASARQLLGEGFVHNRARMISASFLTKHLLVDYKWGEAHYLKYLTDGDWAANNAGWQWSAGCGCDAQPYFRIFNPVTQGERFDPDGAYVRRWVPELAGLDAKYIHSPWCAPPEAVKAAGVALGRSYPRPVVDHRAARDLFLETAKKHLGAARGGTTDNSSHALE